MKNVRYGIPEDHPPVSVHESLECAPRGVCCLVGRASGDDLIRENIIRAATRIEKFERRIRKGKGALVFPVIPVIHHTLVPVRLIRNTHLSSTRRYTKKNYTNSLSKTPIGANSVGRHTGLYNNLGMNPFKGTCELSDILSQQGAVDPDAGDVERVAASDAGDAVHPSGERGIPATGE
jgi:hypothetical protein